MDMRTVVFFIERETEWGKRVEMMKTIKENSSKLYLAKALVELMKTKKLEDISITMLTQKAGVSRMSYYRYFSAKVEILESYLDHLIERYGNEVDSKFDFTFQSYEHILHSLRYFRSHADFMICLEYANLSSLVMERLNVYAFQRAVPVKDKRRQRYELFYYIGALYHVYLQWIKQGCCETEEYIAEVISSLNLYSEGEESLKKKR